MLVFVESIRRLLVWSVLNRVSQNADLFTKDCKNDKTSNVKIDLVDESPFHLKGTFPGPEGTPYEGGTFEVVSEAH